MTLYVDASAAAKLLVEEAESEALARYLDETPDDTVSSLVLETELRRLGVRLELPQTLITEVLDRIELVEPDRAVFVQAGLLQDPALRSLDALHLATALRLDPAAMIVYDRRLAAAAQSVGIAVLAPG